jgi:hypothetical protein
MWLETDRIWYVELEEVTEKNYSMLYLGIADYFFQARRESGGKCALSTLKN